MGARFAKWRAVIAIGEGIPTTQCIEANAHVLSRYAGLCQETGIVPIVEPEVLMNGNHSIQQCFDVSEQVQKTLFYELYKYRIYLEGMILKPNMVIQGLESKEKNSVDEVAKATVNCLLESVPASVPAIAFLSGGQSPEVATAHLNAINKNFKNRLPWVVSFSFARAIQQPALELWKGKDAKIEEAQKLLYTRAKLDAAARPESTIRPWKNKFINLQDMKISPLAGKPAPPEILVDIPRLISAYYSERPDPSVQVQRVSFGTSGHRGSSFKNSFNENHILAITQAICMYRRQQNINGPLFLGMDTHALSVPAHLTAIEVLAANGVEVMIAENNEYTPTPVISHAILTYNNIRKSGLADGIVITPSHNPPDDGGFKYNPPHGGPAESTITNWIEKKANEILENDLKEVKRMIYNKAIKSSTTHQYNFLKPYIDDLINVVDLKIISDSNLKLAVDPLGGAGVHYWEPIADQYKLNLTITEKNVDPTFRFMTVDWDGQIRMDPSSPYAMESLVGLKDKFDIAFACDTDHDRHGIVTKSAGLMSPNHYLSVSIYYLFSHRPRWSEKAMVGKTLVSSQMIDRVTEKIKRKVLEVPVGFKWFVEGLHNGTLGFVGEESAGASFLRMDGNVWTTDKDGIIAALLSAEITAATGKDPGEIYKELTKELGNPVYDRIEAKATPEQKQKLSKLSPSMVQQKELAGEKITNILTNAPGNGAPIGGLKVTSENGWFAARPSGTEDIYKIYAESFLDKEHLQKLIEDAQQIVDKALT